MDFASALITGLVAPLLLLASGSAPPADPEHATFARCGSAKRITCVVDGDTFWYRGIKIRVADIDTPEISRPACPQERALGEQATIRMMALLNAGSFTLAATGRDEDRYGRKLRVVKRAGRSLGAMLVTEGLARGWTGRREGWCPAG